MFPGSNRFSGSYLSPQPNVVAPATFASPQSNMGLNNNVYLQNNNQFTFGSPTQSPIITSSQQYPNPMARGINVHNRSAPGMGVSWQHTVPKQMPWSEPSNLTPTFSSPKSSTAKSHAVPKSSANSSIKAPTHLRTKRHHLSSNDGCPPRKQYISEDKMAAHMQNLCIGNNSSQTSFNNVADGWEKFLDLEERLKDEDIDDTSPPVKGSIIRINEDFKDTILKRDPVLPANVMNKLHKPSLEVVLWRPPEGVVSEIIKKVKEDEKKKKEETSVISLDDEMSGMQDEPFISNIPVITAPNDMEVDSMFDSVDDDMAL